MNPSELVKRPLKYDSEDGVGELMVGLMSMFVGGGYLAIQNLPRTDNIGYIFVPSAPILLGALVMWWGTKRLKERITYPRGGYVAFDETVTIRSRRIPRRALAAASVFALILFIHFFRFMFTTSLAVAGSAMFLGAHIFNVLKYRMLYMLWLAAFSAVLGVWVYVRNDSLLFVMFWQGVALAIAGGIKLWRFMKAHPRPVGTEA